MASKIRGRERWSSNVVDRNQRDRLFGADVSRSIGVENSCGTCEININILNIPHERFMFLHVIC